MERLAIHHLTSYGVSIGFFQGDILKLKEDLSELKPTLFISVPRLYNRFHDLISQQFSDLSGVKRLLATRGLSSKQFYFRSQGSLTHKLWDSLIFQKIKNVLGGRVKIMVTGSAPISGDVIDFLKVVFSCPFIEGYGQTESCGGTFLTIREERMTGIIGGPVTTAEIKLEDIPDMDYRSTDVDPEGRPAPRGEICVRGPVVFAGYYKNPQITAETIDCEGWLHTGDVGTRSSIDGSFKIIDRKKNFFKLQQGEYVSAEKIEMVYNKSYFISQIFVYGDSLQSYLVAIVVPDEAFIRKKWIFENGFNPDTSFEEICRSEKLMKTLLNDMEEKAKESKLFGFELVKKIFIEDKLWTPDDLLTPTQKLMRFNAKKKYESVIADLYKTV
jgi:long-chain acyl-CoA synthetase